MVSQFACKDKFFVSITGLFSHYNNIVDKSKGNDVNLYLYLGKKGLRDNLGQGISNTI